MDIKTPASNIVGCNNKRTPISPPAMENYSLPCDKNPTPPSYTCCPPTYHQTRELPPAYHADNMADPNLFHKRPTTLKAIAEYVKRITASSPKVNYQKIDQRLYSFQASELLILILYIDPSQSRLAQSHLLIINRGH